MSEKQTGKIGEKSNASKLTDLERKRIIELFDTGSYTNVALGKMFSISNSQIKNIINKFRGKL